MFAQSMLWTVLPVVVVLVIALFVLSKIIIWIQPDKMGVRIKSWSASGRKLEAGNVIALNGEPGYQDRILRPGLHFVNPVFYSVVKFPIPVVPPGTVGYVYAQVGQPLTDGAKTGAHKAVFGKFGDVRAFMEQGGQKGMQRPVLQSGELAFVHPVGFLVITRDEVYGLPVTTEFQGKKLAAGTFGLGPEDFNLVIIKPDAIGIVTTGDGPPPDSDAIACRIGGFADMRTLEEGFPVAPEIALPAPMVPPKPEEAGKSEVQRALEDQAAHFTAALMSRREDNARLIGALFASQNGRHNSYQDFQKFIDAGGQMGVQHDPLLPGTYALNRIVIRVERVPMLVVSQGEVALVKSSLGLQTKDTSGKDYKFGSLVRPGHVGLWEVALGTGKYAINPNIYVTEIVPTYILNLSWAKESSEAHKLDVRLSTINARSREGFEFKIDLQVQIHIPDLLAPLVIAMVKSMDNLVNEILHPAVGNHFRDRLQGMPAIQFIETREAVQKSALEHIRTALRAYFVEVRGVYIQDVIPPPELITVLKAREVAVQQQMTYTAEANAQTKRADVEAAKGNADRQAELAGSKLEIQIKGNQAEAREKEGAGEAAYIQKTGAAKGAEVESVNMALAKAIKEQVLALGAEGTTAVNVARAIAAAQFRLVPDVLVTGGAGSATDGILGLVTRQLVSGVAPATARPAEPARETAMVPAKTGTAPDLGAAPPTV